MIVPFFEMLMIHSKRTTFLPIFVTLILVCIYACVMFIFLWLEYGDPGLAAEGLTRVDKGSNVWTLMLASALVQAGLVQAVGSISQQPSFFLRRRARKWLRFFSDFWARMVDQTICLVIFAVLILLSSLPLSAIQTRILFNRAFEKIVNRKMRRAEVLDDLFTPQIFSEVQVDDRQERTMARYLSSVKASWKWRSKKNVSKAESQACQALLPRNDQPCTSALSCSNGQQLTQNLRSEPIQVELTSKVESSQNLNAGPEYSDCQEGRIIKNNLCGSNDIVCI